ncbi:MAG: ribonuclease PH [Victivallales bacterium]|nr:ribonuclease PH [Victivallales bacterium]
MSRIDGRTPEQFRRVKFTRDYLAHPLSSVLVEFGGTKVLCAISLDPGVPNWMRSQKIPGGWITCEYGMIPASTHDRVARESNRGRPSGRTMEIQRLIGRSLRSVIDLEALGANTIYIDCDVIDADGGTRCAGITGASVALQLAFAESNLAKRLGKNPMRENVAAISVGIVDGEPVLDLCYQEDSRAEVDMNVVMTESGKFVEIQGTAEAQPFSDQQLQQMLNLARRGLNKIFDLQRRCITGVTENHGAKPKGPRPGAQLGSLGDVLGDIKL